MSQEHLTPLSELDLSTRTYNALMRGGITTVEELISLSLDKIKKFRHIGEKSIAEIESNLKNFDSNLFSSGEEELKKPNSSNACDNRLSSESINENTSLKNLGLPARIYHALDKEGIATVGELASIPSKQLSEIENIGEKSVAEIHHLLDNTSIDYSIEELTGELLQNFLTISKQGSMSVEVYEKIPIRYLEFSRRINHILERNGINTIRDLLSYSTSQLLDIKQLGERSLDEIKEKLQQIIDHSELSITLSEYIKEDIEEFGEIFFNQIAISRIALPKLLEQKLVDLNITTLDQLLQCSLITFSLISEGDLELIRQRITFYLNWIYHENELTWDEEISGKHLPQLFRVVLNKFTIGDLIMKSLSILPERERQILIWRYGIDGNKYSLQEAGDNLGITRERVRQVQSHSLKKLQVPDSNYGGVNFLTPFIDYLERLIISNNGIINDDELIEIIEKDEIVGFGAVDPKGIFDFICAVYSKFRYEKRMHYISLTSCPTNELINIFTQLRSILDEKMTPTHQEEILISFKNTSYFKQRKDIFTDEFILACLKADIEIEQQENRLFALEKWSSSRLDEMIMSLRDIGHPVHYSEITRKINQLLPSEKRTTPRNIHGHLSRLPEIFVRVGHGIFGLAEWGLYDDGNLANAAQRVIKEVGRPLHIDTITKQVLLNWQVKPESVYVAIQNDDRFTRIGSGVYYLRELPLNDNGIAESDFGDLFGEELEKWHNDFNQQGRNLEDDPYSEVEKLNEVGLDFLKADLE